MSRTEPVEVGMAVEYESILKKLDGAPHLVRRPLPSSEIDAIERDIGLTMPESVRAWLSKVGLFEEISSVNASDFELHTKPEELVASRKVIVELLGDKGSELFPFGHDGAGDEIAVRAAPDGRDMLVFVDHETRRTRDHGLFKQWLGGVVDEAAASAPDAGDEKFWCVQFSFQTPDEKPIFAALETVAPVKIPDSAWSKEPVSPSGAHPAKLAFVFLTQARILKRLTFSSGAPHFFFDYEEPVSVPENQSTIRRLDKLFRSRPELNYKLVDYGPLDWPPKEDDDADEDDVAPKTPWWKFW